MVRASNKTPEQSTSNLNSEQEISKDMFRIGRRSAVSTSELGLYSDHSEYNSNNIHTGAIWKLFIGIMVVVSVILIGIFLYDFASSASINSKVRQDTKHIYILQNSLRKTSNATSKNLGVTLTPIIYIVNSSRSNNFEDRMDDKQNLEYKDISIMKPVLNDRNQLMETELRMRKPNISKIQNESIVHLGKKKYAFIQDHRKISNHALIYRMRSKIPYSEEDYKKLIDENKELSTDSRFNLSDTDPIHFKLSKYPQLTQYQYPNTSRSIQDIIKYLTNNSVASNRRMKFTGFYVGSKKYDLNIDQINTSEVSWNNNRLADQESLPFSVTYKSDPLYQYKPRHPSDVNLLASPDVRFSPIENYKYNSYDLPYYNRQISNPHSVYQETQEDKDILNKIKKSRKKQKLKPFSVMLDIYPIIESNEQRKSDHLYEKNSITYGMHTQSSHTTPILNQHEISAEDEKQQMILHLNLYKKY